LVSPSDDETTSDDCSDNDDGTNDGNNNDEDEFSWCLNSVTETVFRVESDGSVVEVVEEDVSVLHVVDPHRVFPFRTGGVGEVEVLDGGGDGHGGVTVHRVGGIVDGEVSVTELQVQGLVGLDGLVVEVTVHRLIELEGQDRGAGRAGVGEVVVVHDDVEFPSLKVHHVAVAVFVDGGVGVDDVHERDVLEGTVEWRVLRIEVVSSGAREVDDPVVFVSVMPDVPVGGNVNGFIDGGDFGHVSGLKSVHEGDVVVVGFVGGVVKLDLGLPGPVIELADHGDVPGR